MTNLKRVVLEYFRKSLGDKKIGFRDGQWEAIELLLNNNRLLLIQRTGWGKSAVYFIVTKLLRNDRRGITVIILPLISLMNNQESMAKKF